MSSQFVWFDNFSSERSQTTDFLANSFGWKFQEMDSMTFLSDEGGAMPFAATCDEFKGMKGWVPYIEVDDLETFAAQAQKNGATIVAANIQGPAGIATFMRDPGGSPLAIWKRNA